MAAADTNWLSRHLRQDAALIGTLVAFGLSTLVLVIALSSELNLENEAIFALAVVMGPAMGLPGVVVFLVRLLRRPTERAARCQTCSSAPCGEVRYLQCTGMIVLAAVGEARLNVCRRCSLRAFHATTTRTLLLGWWSLLTPLVVPWIVLNNLVFLLKHRWLTRAHGGAALHLLEERRVHAKNLLRSKSPEDVAEVLSKQTGLPETTVARFLESLK